MSQWRSPDSFSTAIAALQPPIRSGQAPDWLAGGAVLIEPVSKAIPWYQGILQGILRFWGLDTRFSIKKPLRCSHFSCNSLRKLSAKIFWETANFLQVSRNFDEMKMQIAAPPRATRRWFTGPFL
jgi:hypothetical protein